MPCMQKVYRVKMATALSTPRMKRGPDTGFVPQFPDILGMRRVCKDKEASVY